LNGTDFPAAQSIRPVLSAHFPERIACWMRH